ncbi:hypothetical protein C10C_0226 [Chlamydia serpentis]|uniref:Uncharacterized protein n=1 Tax=Chlamydia serpentis TaxID=1967782 RepID=A0A2R8FAH6_9CHLA|nr:hypothetical protein [Chlamydia serpentis]SPN73404.1 hypothetical protein C10C_0226 [Chlamydia serpentis]
MKKLKQKNIIVKSSIPPINSNENSGVKDQNLFMDQATLSVEGNATIENALVTRDLKVSDTTISPCEFVVGGNISAEKSEFNATTLSNGINIFSQTSSSRTPVCNNISDPQSARDAITFNYYRKTGCQAANLYTYYPDGYYVDSGASVETNARSISNKTVYFNRTPNASNYIEIDPIVKLKKEGIYQVTFQLTRWSGYHEGDNNPGLFLNFISRNSKVQLCTSDTRGGYQTDRVSVALTSIFPVTEVVPSPPYNYPWVNVETILWINLMSVSTCVIWFPFDFNFAEVD